MKERPILFSGPMVRAIMDGRKTMTRRVVKPQPEMVFDGESLSDGNAYGGWEPKLPPWSKWPYQLGDTLWVRETWQIYDMMFDIYNGGWEVGYPLRIIPKTNPSYPVGICYRATEDDTEGPWRPSIFMPRWASRITLEVTGVRVERLQDITDDDAFAEGIVDIRCAGEEKRWFPALWDSINGKKYSWSDNPLVWVIEFRHMGRE